jgi:hypothetical protein
MNELKTFGSEIQLSLVAKVCNPSYLEEVYIERIKV